MSRYVLVLSCSTIRIQGGEDQGGCSPTTPPCTPDSSTMMRLLGRTSQQKGSSSKAICWSLPASNGSLQFVIIAFFDSAL